MKTSSPCKKQIINNSICRTIISVLLSLLIVVQIQAQSSRIMSGILTDSEGYPLPGVNIYIKGSTIGTTTNLDGAYSIEAPIGSYLVFNYIGYVPTEVLVTPDKTNEKADTLQSPENKKVFKHTIPQSDNKTLSPYFFVKSDSPELDRLPLKSTSAEVTISGVIADVTVKQVYVNEGSSTLEAIYIFPGSTKAAVYGMSMQIGNRLLNAVIKEKQQARQQYEKAKEEGKTATLLEQNRPNVFQMNVANILPGDTIEVNMHYTEMIESTEGIYEFRYPTVVGPRYSNMPDIEENDNESWVENPYLTEGEEPPYNFDLKVQLNSAIPIKKLYSSSHRVIANYTAPSNATILLSEDEKAGGNRDFVLNYGLRGGKVESGVLLYEHDDENFFLLMVEPPKTPTIEDIPGREYIFVVDISGSMNGFPLQVSKSAMNKLLTKLRSTDKFNIMTFAGGSSMMWPESKAANAENIRKGLNFMSLQNGAGGTRLLSALNKAMSIKTEEGYSRTFIVLTDGYVSFEKETFITVRENLNEANLFAMGIGSSVNHYLIEGLAHAGMGDAYVAMNNDEAERIGQDLIDYIEKPVLTDISIDFGDFEAYDYEPSSIPDVFAQRPIIVYGKYTGGAEGSIKVKGVTGNTPYVNSFNLKKAKTENNQALRYLWARNKIKYLDDYAHYYTHGTGHKPYQDEDTKAEVTHLGLKYNLLTQYTSFIAVDSIVRNTRKSTTVKQPLPLPKGVSNLAVGTNSNTSVEYASMSLSEDLQSLDEIVVIGYGVQKSSSITASVCSVREQEIGDMSAVGVNSALQGRVSGVNIINNSGAPGANSNIRIRGEASISANNAPLCIVDGIIQSGTDPLAELNSDNIETIEVIKDATATAIYGSRASNGVIIINTKKAENGSAELKFKAMAGINQADISEVKEYSGSDLWYKDNLRTGIYEKYDLSYSKAGSNLSFYTSAGYLNNNGVIENTGQKRFSSSNNIKARLFRDKLELGGSLQGSLSDIQHALPDYYVQNNINPNMLNPIAQKNSMQTSLYTKLALWDGLSFRSSISKHLVDQELDYHSDSYLNSYNKLNNTFFESNLSYNFSKYNHNFQTKALYELFIEDQKLEWGEPENNLLYQETDYSEKNHALAIGLNYSYYDKYLLHLNLRTEKSILGIENNSWFPLPTMSLGYNLHRENFMNSVGFISQLKIRYSIGKTGKTHLPRFYLVNPAFSNLSLDYEQPDITISDNLLRETSIKQNLGFDFGFFYNRITASVDFFKNSTKDMLYLNNIGDNDFEWTNAGDFTNKGMDLSLKYSIVSRSKFNLSLNLNFASNKTNLEKLNIQGEQGVFRNINGIISGQELKIGDPIGVYYGYTVKSVNNEDNSIELADINNDQVINELDRKAIANTNPKYYGGFGFDANYKAWSLTSQFKYNVGNKVINMNKMNYYKDYSYTGNVDVPENTLFHDLYTENGSFLRMSELRLSYTFSNAHIGAIRFKDIQIAASARNLFVLTNYKGQDPEFNNWQAGDGVAAQTLPGVDMNYYPVSKAIYLSLEVKF